MKALITGGIGFVGTNLADFLLEKNHEVVCLDNFHRKGVERNLEWLKQKHSNPEFVEHDIRKPLPKINCDVIYHTAGQVAVTTSLKNPREDFEINALGSFNVLEFARKNDTAVVFCSTNKVYGKNVNNVPLSEGKTKYDFADIKGIDEKFPLDSPEHTPYGCSKLAADQYVRDYSATYNLRTVVNRMSCIYGTRQFGNVDQGWVVHFIRSAIFDKPLTIFGDGKQVRDILFGRDLAALFEKQGQKGSGVFNVGGGPENVISLLELIEILEDLKGKKIDVSFDDWRPADQKVYYSNINKVSKEFNWKPQVSKKDGIERVYNWILEHKELFS